MSSPELSFVADHFALLKLPQRQALDATQLEANFRELQTRVHPDRHVQASDADKRQAMQWATRVNEAFQTLKAPLSRARYLLHVLGHDAQIESNTAMPTDFLIAQMELREAVADARESVDASTLGEFRSGLLEEMKAEYRALEVLIDDQHDYAAATARVRQLMFQEKLLAEIDDAIDGMETVAT